MRFLTDVIDVAPVESEVLSPERFLKLVKENPGLIKGTEVVHAKAGSSSFGKFRVFYSRPVYRTPFKRARG